MRGFEPHSKENVSLSNSAFLNGHNYGRPLFQQPLLQWSVSWRPSWVGDWKRHIQSIMFFWESTVIGRPLSAVAFTMVSTMATFLSERLKTSPSENACFFWESTVIDRPLFQQPRSQWSAPWRLWVIEIVTFRVCIFFWESTKAVNTRSADAKLCKNFCHVPR